MKKTKTPFQHFESCMAKMRFQKSKEAARKKELKEIAKKAK